MEHLELDVQNDAINPDIIPHDEVKEDIPSGTEDTADEDLTDAKLTEEIDKLKEEAQKVEDPKEKRHLQQQAGRLQQIEKAREKARELEEKNRSYEERLEKSAIEEVYQKATSQEHGLSYFKEVYKTDPQLANKVAKEKWNMSAREAILASSKNNADS